MLMRSQQERLKKAFRFILRSRFFDVILLYMRASREFITAALTAAEHTPNRALGQNFCIDGPKLRACVERLGIHGETVIEIGPGFGGLTELLLPHAGQLIAIEKDARMSEWLKREFSDEKLTVINGDALRFRYEEQERPFSVAGNLPYYITTEISEKILLSMPEVFGCMIQKEAAERFFAGPGNDHYGALSVITDLYYQAEQLDIFPEECFYPAPNVQSVFLAIRKKKSNPPEPVKKVFAFIRTCLGMRRKTLKNNLKTVSCGAEALKEADIPPELRAETLTPEQFLKLYRALINLQEKE